MPPNLHGGGLMIHSNCSRTLTCKKSPSSLLQFPLLLFINLELEDNNNNKMIAYCFDQFNFWSSLKAPIPRMLKHFFQFDSSKNFSFFPCPSYSPHSLFSTSILIFDSRRQMRKNEVYLFHFVLYTFLWELL